MAGADRSSHRRWAAGLMVLAVCLVIVPSVLYVARPVELSMFSYQPADPIMSPAFMGYDASEGAVRELARIAGPLQGAFSPASREQLYSGYRGLGGLEQPVYELVPVGDEGMEAPSNSLPLSLSSSGEPIVSPQQLRFLPSPSVSHSTSEASRTPNAQALSEYTRASRARQAKDSVEKLYSQLHERNTRIQAQPFLQEDQQAHMLENAIGGEASLHSLEPRLASEAQSSESKLHDDEDKLKEAKDDLRLYNKHVQLAEHLGNENVKYLKASQNYAQQAKKEMMDATQRDEQSMKVLNTADDILKQAHTAEVQARVNDNAGELTAAENTISAEIAKVRAAKVNDEIAARERSDAKENAFVSTVIGKVRKQRFDNSKLGVKAIAEEGHDAERAQKQEEEELKEDAARHEQAAMLLSKARYQDAVKAAATEGEEDAAGGMEALAALQHTQEDAARRHTAWLHAMAQARMEERAARQDEEKAAMLAGRPRQ